ncbi:MAG: hypothetical protein AAGI13_03960 [Pseudomonadota bacterium]
MSTAAPQPAGQGRGSGFPGRFLGGGIIAALLLGPLAVAEGLITTQHYDWLFAAAMTLTFWSLLPRTGMVPVLCGPAAFGIGAAAVLAQVVWPQILLAPYLAVATINLGVAWIFWRGLREGAEPVLLQVIRMMRRGPEMTAEFRHFVRGQCRLWCALSAVTALAGLAAMLVPDMRSVLGPAILFLLAGQFLWFILSHHYASFRYGRAETWGHTLRTLSQPAIWADLKL